MHRYNKITDVLKRRPTQTDLVQYGDSFCRNLGSVYRTLQAAKPIFLPECICYPFYFGESPSRDFGGPGGVLRLREILAAVDLCQPQIVFNGNMLLVAKPAQLLYWLRPEALRDADAVFAHLQDQDF